MKRHKNTLYKYKLSFEDANKINFIHIKRILGRLINVIMMDFIRSFSSVSWFLFYREGLWQHLIKLRFFCFLGLCSNIESCREIHLYKSVYFHWKRTHWRLYWIFFIQILHNCLCKSKHNELMILSANLLWFLSYS